MKVKENSDISRQRNEGVAAAASPALRSALQVPAGWNASLACNLTSSDITWYLLSSDQLLPLLTVRPTKVSGSSTVTFHSAGVEGHVVVKELQGGLGLLEIRDVEEKDAGTYFCSGHCDGRLCFSPGVRMTVGGEEEEEEEEEEPHTRHQTACWILGICVFPASILLCFTCVLGLYFCSDTNGENGAQFHFHTSECGDNKRQTPEHLTQKSNEN
ncbi:hypothetical protein LDENG_00259250 [Lucifuga dentata]|nr:hypothetical protein LDENG_00259250 [Lucifuga dentata]